MSRVRLLEERSWPTRPAACQRVRPDRLPCSSSTTSRHPSLVRWYATLVPTMPPPTMTARAALPATRRRATVYFFRPFSGGGPDMAPALPQGRTTVYFFRPFSCGGPDMAPALPQGRTTVYFFRPFSCGGPDMAPALPPRRTTVYFFRPFSCGGPDMAPALPQGRTTVCDGGGCLTPHDSAPGRRRRSYATAARRKPPWSGGSAGAARSAR